MSCRPLPDVVRPLAIGAPRAAPAEVVEEAAEVVDPVTTTAEGRDAGAERGPAGAVGVTECVVAITRRPCSEGLGEGEVVVGTGGGTYVTRGPVLAAPTRLSGRGPKMYANSAAHRQGVGSSGTINGLMPVTAGYTTPGMRGDAVPTPAIPCPRSPLHGSL